MRIFTAVKHSNDPRYFYGGLLQPFCSIIPPHMLQEIAQKGTASERASAWHTLSFSERLRGERSVFTLLSSLAAVSAGQKRRTLYDAQNQWRLPGKLVCGEGAPKNRSAAVNEAYQGAGLAYDFFKKVFGRNSLDDGGMRLDAPRRCVLNEAGDWPEFRGNGSLTGENFLRFNCRN